MRPILLLVPALAAILCAAPAVALQTLILPQPPGDSATNAQDPTNPAPDQFGATQDNDKKSNPFGSFHFNVTSGQDWPGDPYRFRQPQNTTPDAYGSATTPGSEFSTSNTLYPH